MSNISKNGYFDIVDEKGFLISTNLINLTKNGAKYFGKKSILNSPYGKVLTNYIDFIE
jgi:hypothetical protein